MIFRAVVMLCLSAVSLFAQTAVSVNDSNGNHATAAVYNGNFYYHDSKGNFATGIIRNGNVFVNTSNGERVFGTMRNGNVFLTDNKGITTGTIRDGNIFINNADGSFTSGTYDKQGNTFTNTTSPSQVSTQSIETQQQQQEYEAGYAAGYGATSALLAGIDKAKARHRLNSFCKANPASVYEAKDGARTPCQQAPLPEKAQESIKAFCYDHPYQTIKYGLRIITCDTPPDPPNLAWVTWGMGVGARMYRFYIKKNDTEKAQPILSDFNEATSWYCKLTGAGAAYSDVQGHEQHCK